MPLYSYSDSWWVWLIRGIAGILFGLFAFLVPGITFGVLVLWFGIYALVDGFVHLVASFRKTTQFRAWQAIEGVVGILAGIVTMFWPQITAAILLAVIAVWAIVSGIIRIVHAFRLRQQYAQEWLLVLSGILSVIFGVIVLASPLIGGLAIALWVGIYAFILGILFVRLAFWLRRHHLPVPAAGTA